MSEESPTTGPIALLKLEQAIINLERSLSTAKSDADRINNRMSVLTRLLQSHNTMLGQMKAGPEVSMVLFHQQRERIAKTSQELSGAMSEASSMASSIKLGEKTLKEKREELLLMKNASNTGTVLQFKRPDDDGT